MPPETPVPTGDSHRFRMRSRIADVAGVVVLQLAGEIDFGDVRELESSFDRARAGADGVLVLDLERVSFLDLAGLAAIVEGLRKAELEGCVVSVVSAGSRVRKVFAMTGNEALLESAPSLVDVPIAASIEPQAEAGYPDG